MLGLGKSAELLQQLNDGSLPVPEPDRSVLKGDALVTLGEMAAAEALYRSVQEKYPEHVRATLGLALAMRGPGSNRTGARSACPASCVRIPKLRKRG